ncbi:class I SAM-dependent methyltransferase [Salipiger sp. 1_MG-2023]|uniref:class I SAM-dependent methyltransferase n=1 Tax=Salipiger sp. 1_MG-2023 TaxID=3062665 RepID=UPI0026E2D86F|nr:class I SAM-dependent methyltransferase [Salipiger sp. 1_MG-2023]MDO6587022.1 class I SAM-dependent methyltransferase [Salipiger sp. 1_MG-2023]
MNTTDTDLNGGPLAQPDIGAEAPDLDSSSERYARRFEGVAGTWLLSRQTEILRQMIAPWPGARVLDVGGGHRQVADALLPRGHPVCVLASCEQALGRVRDLSHPDLQTQIGSLTALPFADRSFDVVTSFRMLAHVADWQQHLSELTRVARHAVILDYPIPGGANLLGPLLFGLKKKVEGDTRRYRTIARRDMHAALDSHGFCDIRETGQFVFPMVLHRTLKRPRISSALERIAQLAGLSDRIGNPVILRAVRRD